MEQNFIYLIDLNEFLPCINFNNTNSITSILPIHLLTFKNDLLHPIYYCNLENLLTDEKAVQLGFNSPRFNLITLANWHSNGLKIGIGNKNKIEKFYNQNEIKSIIRKAKLEIEFERIRRKINLFLPSRLTSIFLAEDNYEGRTMLKNMFQNRKSNFLIENVKINNSLLHHKADYRWLEEYEKENKEEYIVNYWKGKLFDNYPQFEHLIEGQIELQNDETIETIKNSIRNFC